MELIGLLLAIPFAFLCSWFFCRLMCWIFSRFPMAQLPVAAISSVIVSTVMVEGILSFTLGPWALHRRFEGIHAVIHFGNLLLAAPSITCLFLVVAFRQDISPKLTRVGGICVCWFVCMASLLGNIVVDEAIYGIDGSGIPPSQTH